VGVVLPASPDPAATASLVEALDRVPPPELVSTAVSSLEAAGVGGAVIWYADLGFRRLVDATGARSDRHVESSIEGRALSQQKPVADRGRLHLPLARRGQVIGVLSVDGGAADTARLEPLVVILTSALLASTGHSDVMAMARGAHHLPLAATIQYELLPHPTYGDDTIEIGGQVEPAYDIAGDTYDYAVNGDAIHIGVFDAVGHGLRSTLIATSAIGAYRQHRRLAASLAAVAMGIDLALRPVLAPGEFVTGLLMRIDRSRRDLEVWNAGHPPPLMSRRGEVSEVATGPPKLPFGLGTGGAGETVAIESGDLVMAYTDGVINARDRRQRFLGVDPLATAVAGHVPGTSIQDLCRRALAQVSGYVDGPLGDDATVVAFRLSD
jgi:phosphoserine phosphatase RsbU/P